MEDAGTRGQAEPLGQLARRAFLALEVHLGMVAVAARLDLFVQVADRQRRRDAVELGGEGADALGAVDQPFGAQLAQRPVHGHPADAELGHQFGLRGHPRARGPATGRQAVPEILLDVGVGREGRFGEGGGSHASSYLPKLV